MKKTLTGFSPQNDVISGVAKDADLSAETANIDTLDTGQYIAGTAVLGGA